MNMYHDKPEAGHRGIRATKHIILRSFYWPGIAKDIERYIKSCVQCHISKNPKNKRQGLLGEFTIEPEKGEIIHADYVGPFATTTDGYSYIHTILDRCPGWVELIPSKD